MVRTRREWNDRFEHWQRAASASEEARIERAAVMVRDALGRSPWLVGEGVDVLAQGSYHNNTNVRLDSDMDLRAAHPGIKVYYDGNVHIDSANKLLGYTFGPNLADQNARMRVETAAALRATFGVASVDATGDRAIHVKALPGSRAEADVVPAFVLHYVVWDHLAQRYDTTPGVAIMSNSGDWTFNFPEQHRANGVAKRERTKLRFKRAVRMLKRLRNEMADLRILAAEPIPSYLVECLAYRVEDVHYLVESDDHFDRTRRIIYRLKELMADPAWVSVATEVNDVKRLFGSWQRWKPEQVTVFLNAARAHLGA
jgi:hypothetical protein